VRLLDHRRYSRAVTVRLRRSPAAEAQPSGSTLLGPWAGAAALPVTVAAAKPAWRLLTECTFLPLTYTGGLQCFDAVGWAAGRASGL